MKKNICIKKILLGAGLLCAAMTLLFSLSATAKSKFDSYYFSGIGNCFIETYPCDDGEPIRCTADGYGGGYCRIEQTKTQFIIECHANSAYGSQEATVTRSCYRKK